MKIGIIGKGIVGNAIATVFENQGHEIFIHDKYKSPSLALEEVVKNSELNFVCVPTPSKENGGIDLSEVNDAVEKINWYAFCQTMVVIKSTVVPGTTMKLQRLFPKLLLASNPEFLDEDHAIDDFMNSRKQIIGSVHPPLIKKLLRLYSFMKCYKFVTDPTTAELAKYANNAFYVLKVVYANQLFDLCQKLKADYNVIKRSLEVDKYGSKNHWEVYHKGYRGAGGKCLKKDLDAFLNLGETIEASLDLLQAARKLNNEYLDGNSK